MPEDISAQPSVETMGIKLIGIVLIGVNAFFGLTHQVKAWPFACYPTFASIVERPQIEMITILGVVNGREELVDIERVKKWMGSQKYGGLIENIMRDRNDQRKRVRLAKLLGVFQSMGVGYGAI